MGVDQELADERHVGTMDLDVGLSLAIFDQQRYAAFTERSRQAGFAPDENDGGKLTRQRWKIEGEARVTVDFLIAPEPGDTPGKLKNIESDFAAVIAPGLGFALRDRLRIQLDGRTIVGERAKREVWCASAAAFVVLKALAFRYRGENKDAYDLVYVLKQLRTELAETARRLSAFSDDPSVSEARQVLEDDFSEIESIGPRRVAIFLSNGPDEAIQADARGVVLDFLDLWRSTSQ